MSIDPLLYRDTLGHYPTGVAVVTAVGEDGRPAGMVVGSFTSVSLDPPLVAFFPMRESGSFARMRTSAHFCVNVLAADQEAVCRRFASREPDKFDGVGWRPARHGSPILDDAVAWIECSYERIFDGGDHFIVLGRVEVFEVSRPASPLLFFQGGYGRFSLRSLVASSEPDLIQAVRLAEAARGEIERLALEYGVDCSLLAKVGADAVIVLTSEHSPAPSAGSVGHRVPLIPPLGAALVLRAGEQETREWLARSPAKDTEIRDRLGRGLERVRERGYSLALGKGSDAERFALAEEYSSPERLPAHDRRIRQLIADRSALYEPDLDPGERYDVQSIVTPLPSQLGAPELALRVTGLPAGLTGAQVDVWTLRLKDTTSVISQQLSLLTH